MYFGDCNEAAYIEKIKASFCHLVQRYICFSIWEKAACCTVYLCVTERNVVDVGSMGARASQGQYLYRPGTHTHSKTHTDAQKHTLGRNSGLLWTAGHVESTHYSPALYRTVHFYIHISPLHQRHRISPLC